MMSTRRRWRPSASEPAFQVAMFAVMVILCIWLVLGHSLWVLRGQVEATTRNDVAALSRSLEAHLSAWLEKSRLVVGRASELVRTEGIPYGAFDGDFAERLVTAIDHVEQISGLGVFGADGIIRHAVVRGGDGRFGPVGHQMDVNERDYVQSMDTHPASTLFIGTPVQSLADGQWVLPMSRPIRDSVGALSGGVVALIDIQTLVSLFDSVRPEGYDRIAVLRDDGVLLARLPLDMALLGHDMSDDPLVRQALRATDLSVHVGAGLGLEHGMLAVLPARGFPVTVIAGTHTDNMLAVWNTAVWRSVVIGVTVASVVGIMALVLVTQWRRRRATDVALERSRRALNDSLDRFERAIAGSTSALWEFDLRGKASYFAPQWEDMLGWREVEDPFAYWRDHLHPDDRDRVLAAMDAHLETRVPFDTEYRLLAADGAWRWVKARGQAAWGEDGRPTVMSGTVHDITSLRLSEERLRLALEATDDGLWDWNVVTGRLFLSSSWKTMLGHAPDAPLAPRITTVLRLLHPADRGEAMAWMRRFAAGELDVGEMEYRLRRADGQGWTWVRAAAKVTARDDTGRPLRVVGTHQDITRRRAELRLLEQARAQAEEGSRAKSEFLATMSHELRTPLNAISGFSESLECQFFGALNGKQLEYIRDIRASADHLTSLISDILDMAKIEAGHSDLREESIDVSVAIHAKVQMVRQRAAEKGLELVEDLEPLPPYRLDARRFGQMVLNLLSNAVKFTPSGGTITVCTSTDSDGDLTVAVSDTGIGIADSDLARVLEPFTQVDSRLSREYEGTGLGLPLVKAMVEMHGGELRLISSLGRGTTCILRFPGVRRVAPAVVLPGGAVP